MSREDKPPKSVITCDLEGRIETYNAGAEAIFGYQPDEVIGQHRVSLFSPGLVVLGHVEDWLETAKEEGEYRGRTCFVRKNGERFAADIRITTTHRDGEHIGYCGQTRELEEVGPEEAMPEIGLGTRLMKWLVITRAPFLSAVFVPLLIAAAWVVHAGLLGDAGFPWGQFAVATLGALALQVAANTFNDYYDWTSGTDPANNAYFQALSGGSRAMELRLISADGMFRVGMIASLVAVGCGAALVGMVGPGILAFGLVGLGTAYFYTAPPLRLVARKGLGELFVGLNFGPLVTAGMVYALTGQFHPVALLVGVPSGLLTAAILWINEFPDAPADATTDKNHLVVVLGKRPARWGYAAVVAAAFLVPVAAWAAGIFPLGALLFLAGLPLAVYAVVTLFKHYDDRQLVGANKATIAMQAVTGMLMAVGFL